MVSVTLDNELLNNALTTVKATLGQPGVIHFDLEGKSILKVSGSHKGTGVALYIPCKASKSEGAFSIDHTNFTAALTGRKEIEIEIGGNTINLKGKRYKAELVTVTAEREKVIPKKIREGEEGLKLSPELIEFIRSNISEIELHPILKTSSFMPIAVRSTKKGTIMACYDDWHMAFVISKKVTGKVAFSLPISSLSLLIKEFRGKSYKIHLTDATLYAFNDSFELALPLPQQESQNVIPPDDAFESAFKIRKQTGIKIVLSTDDMQSLAPNMEAVYKQGEHVDFKVEKSLCKIILKSTHGKVVSAVRCKSPKEINFTTGFGFLKDILTKMPKKKIELTLVPQRMIFFSKGNRTFMLGLYEKEAKSE